MAVLLGDVPLTVGAAVVGLLRLDEQISRTTWNCRREAGTGIQGDVSKRVKLGPTGLYYFEGDNMLRLTVEMADGRRVDWIVYVWTPNAWVREMPAWCRHRREEVLTEIKRLTADRRIRWVDED